MMSLKSNLNFDILSIYHKLALEVLELLYVHNRGLELIDKMSDKTNVVGINPSHFFQGLRLH